jgi:hypothetical protein
MAQMSLTNYFLNDFAEFDRFLNEAFNSRIASSGTGIKRWTRSGQGEIGDKS